MDNTQRIEELKELIVKFKHNPFKYAIFMQELERLNNAQKMSAPTPPTPPTPPIPSAPKTAPKEKASATKGKRGRAGASSGMDILSDSNAQKVIASNESMGKKNAELTKLGYSVKDIAEGTGQRMDVVRMDVYRAKKKGLI